MDFGMAIKAVANSHYTQALMLLIAADFVTGVIDAVRAKVFSWAKLGNILPKNVLMGSLVLIAQAVGKMQGGGIDVVIDVSTFGVLVSTLSVSILDNIKGFTGVDLTGYLNAATTWLLGWLAKKPTPLPPPTTASTVPKP